MCFKRKPKYNWKITITTDNGDSLDQAYDFTKEQLVLVNDTYYATVKRMNDFCLYVINHVVGMIRITAETYDEESDSKVIISIKKVS
jgi:hypothetical protein